MVEISVEHILMFMIVIFLLYHLVNNCGCMKNGFSVGNQSTNYTCISQGTNSIPFNCDSASGILKYNASKIVCPNNKCTFKTCCDNINTSCTQALNEICPYDLDAEFKSECIQCVGHDNPLKMHKAGCLHNDLADYCKDQPGRETRDLITPGFYKTGINLPYDPSGWLPALIGDINVCKAVDCPKGSTIYENTKQGCIFSSELDKVISPIFGQIVNNRNICKLDKEIKPTDEVIDVRKLNLGNATTFYLLDMNYCALNPGSLGPESKCYNTDGTCATGCTPKLHNDGFICKNITNMGKTQGNGEWYKYPDSNISVKGTKIGPKDPILDVLNMLFCSFNISRIGVDKKEEKENDYTINFITNNANAKEKHYNYTFIDNTGDNYDIRTSYYSGVNRTLNYSSESPQINYIIKSS
jgi:hypothetical protein